MAHSHSTSISRRKLLLGGLAAAGGLALPFRQGNAASLVNGQVRLVIPYTTGTTPDMAARLLAPKFAEHFGQSFVVENRPGASGLIGSEVVAKAPPDGQTLMITSATHMTLPLLYSKMPFDVLDSFEPVSMICTTNFALVANPQVPADNLAEFIKYAKANPGAIDYGTPGKGTLHQLWMEQLCMQAGISMVHVPYKGAAGATTDVVAGHIKTAFLPVRMAAQYQQEKRLKVYGVISAKRDPNFPDIPSISEAGLPGFSGDTWYAMLGPKGMSPELVAAYDGQVRSIFADPTIRGDLARQGVIVRDETPAQLRAVMTAELKKWTQVIKDGNLNIRLD